MTEEIETYLNINPYKFEIYLFDKKKNINLYKKEKNIDDKFSSINFNSLNNFLNENIFKIEKLLSTFIKDIIFVVNHKDLLSVDMSIKKNNNGNEITLENIKHSLNEIKSQFEDSFRDKTLIHMIINKYLIDGKEFFTFPQNLNCQIFSLDVTFISLSNNLIKELEIICKKYHISISKFVSAEYVKKISQLNNDEDIFSMTKKIINGFNDNEVVISSKISRKKGFFERFFQLFG
mgnify:CR=1 FL=1